MNYINRLLNSNYVTDLKFICWLLSPYLLGLISDMIDISNSDIDSKLWLLVSILITIIALPIYQEFYMNDSFEFKLSNKTLIIAFTGLYFLEAGLYIVGYITNAGMSLNQKELVKLWATHNDQLYIYFVQSSIVTPIFEEILFRGVIYILIFKAINYISKNLNKDINTIKTNSIINFTFILVSSILFAGIHLTDSFITALPYIYSGVLLAIIYVIAKNLLVTILVHSLHNSMIFLNFNIKDTFIFISILIIVTLLIETIIKLNKN